MPTPRLTRELAEQTVELVQACVDEGFSLSGSPSAIREAARRADLDDGTLANRYRRAWHLYKLQAQAVPATAPEAIEFNRGGENFAENIRAFLISAPRTLAELVSRTSSNTGAVLDVIEEMQQAGVNIHRVGDRYEIPRQAALGYLRSDPLEIKSDAQNCFIFGALGDNHCGSKYERRDVFADLYDRFAKAGVKHVFHTGNYLEGDARFNRHDVAVSGLEQQCQLLAETYPQRDGITTYAVWGDDHEGWYAQREGIDVGAYCQAVMRRNGREDWVDLGFMEAHVKLVNANTGASAMMNVQHPGGGSAYALSYRPQKIIEAMEGGEKPAILLIGHYHKLDPGLVRNVWYFQAGTGQDQTPFMRKKAIEAHVGGGLIECEQDPANGAIVEFTPRMRRYFNRGFYSGRWSHHGPVTQAERTIGGL